MNARPSSLDPEVLLRQSDWLRALAATLVGDASSADDVVQETWVRALERPPRRTGDERSLRAWLATVMRNLASSKARNASRVNARERDVATDEARESVADAVERVAAQRELVDAVMSLDPLDRDIVVLRYFLGLPPREIAVRLSLSDAAVRTRLSRSLDRLRARLDRKWNNRAAWLPLLGSLSRHEPAAAASASIAPSLFVLGVVGKLAAAAALIAGFAAWFFMSGPAASPAPAGPVAPLAPLVSDASEEREAHTDASSSTTQRAEVATAAQHAQPGELASTPTYALVARFVDAGGKPIRAAELTAPRMKRPSKAVSGDDGQVRLELGWPFDGAQVGVNEFELRASGPALASNVWYVEIEGPGDQQLGDIAMQPGGAVRGRVVDVAGRPFAGAHVFPCAAFQASDAAALDEARTFGSNLSGVGNGGWFDDATGADGVFELEGVAATHVSICAFAQGMLKTISAPLAVAAGATVLAGDLVIEPPTDAHRIAGVVLGPDDAALPNIAVALGEEPRFPGAHTKTDASGKFELLVARDATYSLVVSRDDDNVAAGIRVEGVVAGTTNVVVRLAATRSIEIVARTPDGAAPPIARVATWDEQNRYVPSEVEHGEGGIERLRTPDRAFFVSVVVEGWRADAQGPFTSQNAPERLTFELRRRTGLAGRVVAGGAPVAGATVHAHSASQEGGAEISDGGFYGRFDGRVQGEVRTDSDGRFLAPLWVSGQYTLHAEADGYARAELGPLTYRDGANSDGVEIALARGGAIEGRVMTAEGVEARGTIVGAGCGDMHVVTQKVGEDARFRFDNLTPGRWQVLRCEPDSLARLEGGVYLAARPGEPVRWTVDVRAGETSHFDLDLRDRVPCHLRGQIVVDGSAPIGWRCNLGSRATYEWGLLDVDGRFELSSQQAGEHAFNLFGPTNGAVRVSMHQQLQLAPGVNTWSVALATGRVVIDSLPKLAVVRENDELLPHYVLAARGAEGWAWRTSIVSADAGALTISGVPAGAVQLIARPAQSRRYEPDETWPVVRELTVTAGVETRVVLP